MPSSSGPTMYATPASSTGEREITQSKEHIILIHFLSRGELVFGGHLEQSLWYTRGHPFAISCYLWCTEDGNVPTDGNGGASGNDLSPLEIVSIPTSQLIVSTNGN